jgi:thioredoxin 1
MSIVLRKISKPACAPCALLANVLRTNASMLEEHGAELIEQDIGDNPELIEQYGISSAPTVIFEKDGEEVARLAGARAISEVFSTLERISKQ